jgi:hypothetical protein
VESWGFRVRLATRASTPSMVVIRMLGELTALACASRRTSIRVPRCSAWRERNAVRSAAGCACRWERLARRTCVSGSRAIRLSVDLASTAATKAAAAVSPLVRGARGNSACRRQLTCNAARQGAARASSAATRVAASVPQSVDLAPSSIAIQEEVAESGVGRSYVQPARSAATRVVASVRRQMAPASRSIVSRRPMCSTS